MDRLNLEEQRFFAFKRGDRLAFESYFDTYYGSIIGFCIQFLGDHDKAQSVAQEAFIKLWLNRGKVKKINGIKSFLYTAAKTQCLDVLRHQTVTAKYRNLKLHEKENNLNAEILKAMNFDDVSFQELEALVDKTISKLPPQCRTVFLLSRYESKKNKEIANELNISIKAVEGNITRALKIFRIELSNYLIFILFSISSFLL
ncbi:RNA polymerase sigma-70 factor [Arenibacter certesii]|uniref:DNA-directed RNA polymerase sigma-70 factor n=1 Tax=Arenibacter certesii TaxID=228955 RepID=A0A918J3F5_9FLAO|nr:RNA polymerase sigma-70 factor [Arenibacter certesii]GGW45903.1 DNA-directed RNA polymerase sigma-70 factor [Arenibacter certesii]